VFQATQECVSEAAHEAGCFFQQDFGIRRDAVAGLVRRVTVYGDQPGSNETLRLLAAFA
jgi:hypothetical protein